MAKAKPLPHEARRGVVYGETRTGNFDDSVHQATFAAVIKSRKTDQDALTFPEPPGDD